MRLFVLGATGKTGKEIIDLALARGHDLTAFVRSPAKITQSDRRLTVVKGDPRSLAAMCSVLSGHDAVLSALGPTPWEAMTHSTLLRECAASAVEAMERSGVRRLSIVSSAMLFPLRGPLPSFLRFLLRAHVEDLKAMERIVTATKLDWTIARPPRLVATREESYRAQPNDLPTGATLSGAVLSWVAVAAFMLDSLEDDRHSRQVVGVCR